MKKKVLLVITLSEVGGAQRHVGDLITSLKHDTEFLLVTGAKGWLTEFCTQQQVPVILAPSLTRSISPFRDIMAIIEVYKIITEWKPDVVHLHSSKAGVIGRIAAFFSGIPSIFTAHGWAFTPRAPFAQRITGIVAENFLYPLTAKIICVSNQDVVLARKKILLTRFLPRKISVIHNTTFIGFPHNESSSQHTVTMICRFSSPKRPDIFAKAAKLFFDPKVKFVLMGDGVPDPLWKNENLIIVLNSTDPKPILSKTDILVLTSEHEGLPISLLEGMAAGCALIASNVGGVPEIIRNEENGFLLETTTPEELAEKIKCCLDSGRLNQMKNKSIEIFKKKFSPELFASKHREIYLNIRG